MRPIIGIPCDTYIYPPDTPGGRTYDISAVGRKYIDAIEAAGGSPLLLPSVSNQECAIRFIDAIDGLLLTGGEDIDPSLYGEEPQWVLGNQDEEKDRLEYWLVEAALERNLPIFGICRGAQMLNVVAGGSLYQDVRLFSEEVIKHYQRASGWHPTHSIEIEPNSKLFEIIGERSIRVNSFHHQAVKDIARGFKVTAKAKDGIIEALESQNHPFVLGVQFHPEAMWQKHPKMAELFKTFIRHATVGV
jgi:putative glutamine amidotransferase